ncbi:MAG: ABC transporter permease, partial [Solirubrobacterales bacterium]
MRANLITVWALVRRSGNELLRVPGAAIPGVLAPTIFFLGITSVFGNLTNLPGFTSDSFQSFMVPVSLMQGASFTGAAQGVNLARDIEAGWFDRLLASPAPRWVLLGGIMASAALRSLIPGAVVLLVAMATGAHFPGLLGLAIATVVVMGVAAISSTWGSVLALKFKSQSAA